MDTGSDRVAKKKQAKRPKVKATIGRPLFEPTPAQWREIEKRASYGCTHQDIADYLGVSKRTFYAPHLRERFERLTNMALAQKRFLLRQARIDAAIAKPTSITGIWVDKNVLGWTDKHQVTGSEGGPLEVALSAQDHLSEVLDRLAARLTADPQEGQA